jgi:hypothetical protein
MAPDKCHYQAPAGFLGGTPGVPHQFRRIASFTPKRKEETHEQAQLYREYFSRNGIGLRCRARSGAGCQGQDGARLRHQQRVSTLLDTVGEFVGVTG